MCQILPGEEMLGKYIFALVKASQNALISKFYQFKYNSNLNLKKKKIEAYLYSVYCPIAILYYLIQL